ncbi:MAG: Asp-tRNA(Asn)/Glu-tRNA(Gln) amidotransferase subunit GatC [Pseudomonadota bacterium]
MSVDTSEVQRIAQLSRLAMDDDQAREFAVGLSDIFAFVEQLDGAAIQGVDPMAHPLDATQRMRPDAVTEPDRREAYQAIAPAVEGGLYLVPRVIE